MTSAEVAELRGELFGLKILLINCVGFIAAITDDPDAHLRAIYDAAIGGIASATHDNVRPTNLQTFRAAAAGIVDQVVVGAGTAANQVLLPQRLQ